MLQNSLLPTLGLKQMKRHSRSERGWRSKGAGKNIKIGMP
jgi:hypothetical protein